MLSVMVKPNPFGPLQTSISMISFDLEWKFVDV